MFLPHRRLGDPGAEPGLLPATYAYDFGDDAFDPANFDSAAVMFDDPKKRWKKAFERRR